MLGVKLVRVHIPAVSLVCLRPYLEGFYVQIWKFILVVRLED